MTNIFLSGGSPALAQSQGLSSWIDKLLPVAVIAVIGYLIYQMLIGSGSGGSTKTTATAPTAPTTYVAPNQPGTSTLSNLIGSSTPTTKAAAASQPVYGGSIVRAPTTYGNVDVNIINTGKGTPSNFFPIAGAGVLTVSEPISAGVAAQHVAAIVQGQGSNFDYLRMQWGITQPVAPVGLGVVQGSQFASGQTICADPGAGAPSTDTWHYCP